MYQKLLSGKDIVSRGTFTTSFGIFLRPVMKWHSSKSVNNKTREIVPPMTRVFYEKIENNIKTILEIDK